MFVYIGSYAEPENPGIHVLSFDSQEGLLTRVGSVSGIKNPTFLDIDSENLRLDAVSAIPDFDGQPSGGIVSYRIDPETGQLEAQDRHLSQAPGPCYVRRDRDKRVLLISNYRGGGICMYPLNEQGQISGQAQPFKHEGSGIVEDRQEGPHPHSIQPDPSNRYVLVPDLGADKLFIYQLDTEDPKLTPYGELKMEPGSGPRHMDFHPNGRYAYIMNELGNTVTVCSYEPQDGSFRILETVPTLPESFTGTNTAADIHLSADGRFLYGSNRGHDSIAVYSVDADSGLLTFVEHVSTEGKTPRNFALSPDNRFLLAANQDTNNIVIYRRDAETGRLHSTGHQIEVWKPVCIKFLF